MIKNKPAAGWRDRSVEMDDWRPSRGGGGGVGCLAPKTKTVRLDIAGRTGDVVTRSTERTYENELPRWKAKRRYC